MVGTYEVRLDEETVGQAQVEKQGLYYRFSCRCRLAPGKLLRLTVRCGEKETDLGVFVPMDGQFGVEKKLPCKQFGTGKPEFYIGSRKQRTETTAPVFYPVYPEEPFAHIRRLKDAYLETKNGQMGIVFRE